VAIPLLQHNVTANSETVAAASAVLAASSAGIVHGKAGVEVFETSTAEVSPTLLSSLSSSPDGQQPPSEPPLQTPLSLSLSPPPPPQVCALEWGTEIDVRALSAGFDPREASIGSMAGVTKEAEEGSSSSSSSSSSSPIKAPSFDVVVGADIVYGEDLFPILLHALDQVRGDSIRWNASRVKAVLLRLIVCKD